MNSQFWEPTQCLLFFGYGLYEITANDSNGGYLHSNHALLYKDMPDEQRVQEFKSIKMLLKPSHIQHVDWLDTSDTTSYPSKAQLIADGWNEINITAPDDSRQTKQVCGGLHTKQRQYTIPHIGATTIDHSQGMTILTQVALECTPQCKPWMKSQVVVIFSRTKTASHMVIVGKCEEVLDHLWELIKKPTQWT
jgi:hypothetical protein